MFQCSDTVDWTVTPQLIQPRSITMDSPTPLSISRSEGAVLLCIPAGTPNPDGGGIYLQIMPAPTVESKAAFPDWTDLEKAVKMTASVTVQGQLTYYPVSQWGRTSDGQPFTLKPKPSTLKSLAVGP